MNLRDLTLEAVLTGRGYADLPASPLQIAIARAAQGRPLDGVIDADTCERHFGVSELAAVMPTIVCLVAGVRAGKSFLAACAAIWASLTCSLDTLKPHELPRFTIVGPRVDAARATFVLLLGILQGSALLRSFIDGSPTADTVVIRRPDGRRVEIVVVAASRGGITVRNRWLCGLVLEEVASFGAEDEGAAVTGEDILRAAETRLLPGCQAWLISSPFGPQGLLHDTHSRHFGKPGRVLVVHAPTRALNPSFPQEQIDAIAAESPDIAAREYGAEWTDADSAFLPAVLIDKAMRGAPYTRGGRATAAAMDPATRSNGWTFAVAWSQPLARPAPSWTPPGMESAPVIPRARVVVGGVWQWQGSKASPLDPRVVLSEIAGIAGAYRIKTVHTDQWSFDSLTAIARGVGLTLTQPAHSAGPLGIAAEREAPWHHLKALLGSGDIELPPHPVMRSDLLSVRQRATSGSVKIHLPKTANGRHADFAPAVALAAYYARRPQWSTRSFHLPGL